MLFRDLEQRIVKDINESGMSIDAIYFIMKSLMQEIEQKYFEQCNIEDIKNLEKKNKNKDMENKIINTIEQKEEGTD